MKAVLMPAVGPADVLQLQEVPEPQIRTPTQVKVRLHAAGVNPVDTKVRKRGLFYPDALPAILGCDGAGVVEAVGSSVTRLAPGDEVWFCNGGIGGDPGNYAEYTVVDEGVARLKPKRWNFEQSAAAPLVLITAWEALFDRAQLNAGKTVLVHAGAGGVGHVAIQLARLGGARVCTTVSTQEKADFARSLGAEYCILYRDQTFIQAIGRWTEGRGVDIALDTIGGEVFQQTLSAVAHYGDIVTLLDPGTDVQWVDARNRNLRVGFELMLTPMVRDLPQARAHQGEILDRCAAWIDEGKLQIELADVLPLEQATQAHLRIEEGHIQGKLVLKTS